MSILLAAVKQMKFLCIIRYEANCACVFLSFSISCALQHCLTAVLINLFFSLEFMCIESSILKLSTICRHLVKFVIIFCVGFKTLIQCFRFFDRQCRNQLRGIDLGLRVLGIVMMIVHTSLVQCVGRVRARPC